MKNKYDAYVYIRNDLFNANVEALARDESGTGVCYNSITTEKVYHGVVM